MPRPASLSLRLSLAIFVAAMHWGVVAAEPSSDKPATTDVAKPAGQRAGVEFFEARIRPVLVKHCYECHSADSKDVKGGLLVDTRDGLRRGGDSGPAVVPKNVADSLLIDALEFDGLEMPPAGRLPPEVVADFKRWITMGAPDPRGGKSAGPIADAATPGKLWSLEPIASPTPPQVRHAAWPLDDVDRFVLAKLEAAKLRPAAEAEPLVLVRRLYFDLVGLPPPPEVVRRFASSAGDFDSAYAALVDELLASPQFGERWGRHWLDAARFAESNGKDRDVLFPHAWRYRRYVVDSFNADKPYDAFLREQIAGDLLPASSVAEKTEHLIATGFLTLGPKNLSMNGPQFQMDVIDEQIDAVSRAVLGLTVACARCHDHKFDPIPTKDYYALAGIFAGTETLYGKGLNRSDAPLQELPDAAGGSTKKEREEYEKRLAALTKRLTEAQELAKTSQTRNAELRKKGETPTAEQIQERAEAADKATKLADEIAALKKSAPQPAQLAMAVREGKPKNVKVHIRGETTSLGDEVPRGFLSAVAIADIEPIDADASGRLELAAWLTAPTNPLPARVAVNRVWAHLFGEGLARTSDNFGRNGEAPTHPELLDHLATRFTADGWSTKRLIRALVLSRTYRLSSAHDDACYAVDPDNHLRWRMSPRRLEAEAIRDAILAASGKLDLTPPETSPVAEIGNGEVGRGINMDPLTAEFSHRSLYLPILRTMIPEVLQVFDFAEPSMVVGRRNVTTIPAQSLFLLNNPWVIDQADAMAARLLARTDLDDAGRVRLAVELSLGREPSDAELGQALEFIAACSSRFAKSPSESDAPPAERPNAARLAWAGYCQALFAGAEFRYLQ